MGRRHDDDLDGTPNYLDADSPEYEGDAHPAPLDLPPPPGHHDRPADLPPRPEGH